MKFICTSSEYCQCRVAKGHQSSLCGFGGACCSQATNNAELAATTANSDYTAALKLAREYMDTNVPSHSVGDFIYQMEQRLNPPKAADCA